MRSFRDIFAAASAGIFANLGGIFVTMALASYVAGIGRWISEGAPEGIVESLVGLLISPFFGAAIISFILLLKSIFVVFPVYLVLIGFRLVHPLFFITFGLACGSGFNLQFPLTYLHWMAVFSGIVGGISAWYAIRYSLSKAASS